MSDSIDRVFAHALNTVKKIPRTGTARPPAAERLKLYGLYKQSMEGDVEGIMDRPIGDRPDVQAEREKWDAWYSQRDLSRTEAKRRYITTLIDTMHMYASQTAEARELVSELEFVWDQIKSNPSSSSSSSPRPPMNTHNSSDGPPPIRYGSIDDRMSRSNPNEDPDEDLALYRRRERDSRLRVLSPVSQPDDEDLPHSNKLEKADTEEDDEEFQEARDGYYEEADGEDDRSHQADSRRKRIGRRVRGERDWRRRVEQALTKMTAEMAAVREQIESRPHHHRRRSGLWAWLKWLFWIALRQIFLDLTILAAVLIWMRFQRDRRLERRLRAALSDFRDRVFTMRIPRRMPRLGDIPLP